MRLIIFISTLFLFNISFGQEQNCDIAKRKYLLQNPDVAKAGFDAWVHFERHGKSEGRKWPDCNVENLADELRIASVKFDFPTEFLSRKIIIDKKLLDYAILKKSEDSLIKVINLYKPTSTSWIDTTAYRFLMNKNNIVFVLKNTSDMPYYKKMQKISNYRIYYNRFNGLIFAQNSNGKCIFNYTEKGVTWISQQNGPFFIEDCIKKRQYNLFTKKELKRVLSIIKKYKKIVTIEDQDRQKFATQLTGVDEHYFVLLRQQKKVQTKIKDITSLYLVNIRNYDLSYNEDYFYFGESSNNQANGFGYLISKKIPNIPIVMVANWINGYPLKIIEAYIYSGMHYTGDTPSLELIIKNTSSYNRLIINNDGLIAGNYNGRSFHGSDIFRLWDDGNYYKGTYENGKRSYGLFVFKNGEKYMGSFDSNGARSGTGKYYWPSGAFYEGGWSNNYENGYGKMVSSNGYVSEGIWQDNNLIKSKETIDQERIAEETRQEQAKIAKAMEDQQYQNAINKIISGITINTSSQPEKKSNKNHKATCKWCQHSFSNAGYDIKDDRGSLNGCRVEDEYIEFGGLVSRPQGFFCSKKCAFEACQNGVTNWGYR